MDARFDILRRLNLKGLIAGSMIMDYGKVAHEVSPEQYVRDVVAGIRFDNNLSKQLKKGFRALNVIPNYAYDPRSLHYAVGIVWENPDYNPAIGALPTWTLHQSPTDTDIPAFRGVPQAVKAPKRTRLIPQRQHWAHGTNGVARPLPPHRITPQTTAARQTSTLRAVPVSGSSL